MKREESKEKLHEWDKCPVSAVFLVTTMRFANLYLQVVDGLVE